MTVIWPPGDARRGFIAPWAADPAAGRGRLIPERTSPTRTEFQRDRDRIIHSTAFRRLAHKTQVFVPHEGDHYRTRLTHTIEVGQIARALSRALGLDDDLAEALALAHDLGHTPFGHTGEEALEGRLTAHGGFDHNAQALRIVTRLERRYATYDGLNLSWETLEGLVKHNGPMAGPHALPRYARRGVPREILDFDAGFPLDLSSFASAEAQAAAISDDIAYNAHDLDDGLRAGLFDVADLREVDLLRDILDEIDRLHPGLERPRVIHEIGRRVITRFVEDAIVESRRRLEEAAPQSVHDVRRAGRSLISFSEAYRAADAALKAYLYPHMYRHDRIMKVRAEAAAVVERLFDHYAAAPESLPREWGERARRASGNESHVLRILTDYIAGMTDRYALAEHRKLFGDAPSITIAYA